MGAFGVNPIGKSPLGAQPIRGAAGQSGGDDTVAPEPLPNANAPETVLLGPAA